MKKLRITLNITPLEWNLWPYWHNLKDNLPHNRAWFECGFLCFGLSIIR